MKKSILLMALLFCGLQATAQEQKKTIQKEVNVTEENGKKTVVVTTTENGKKSMETYTGPEADAKLAELEKETQDNKNIKKKVEVTEKVSSDAGDKKMKVEKKVEMREVAGEKVLTIKTTENGKQKVEEFKGEAADKMLKELEAEQKPNTGVKTKEVKKVEKKVEKKELKN